MELDELVKQLSAAYGDALRAIVLYGSAAAGEQVRNKRVRARSDQNVLVIVREVPFARAKAIAAATRAWRDAGNPLPMTFTETEWRTSSDVFPMEYADIVERHRVLAGTDPFDGIRVERADLRLQIEREARGVVLRLRNALLAAGDESKEQLAVLEGSLSSVMIVLRAIVRLAGEPVPSSRDAVIARATALAGVDKTSIAQVSAHVHGGATMDAEGARALAPAYLTVMERVAAYVDGLPATGS